MKWNKTAPAETGIYKVKGNNIATYETIATYEADTSKWYNQIPGFRRYRVYPDAWRELTPEEFLKYKAKQLF